MEGIRCPGCMQLKTKRPLCEHCGYNENIDNLPHQLPVGTILQGRYEIGKALGQGGFGITYIGWDFEQQIPVAIKEFYPKSIVTREMSLSHSVIVGSTESREGYLRNKNRFQKEAITLARLNDIPQIVHIYQQFEENNTVYIVMEYLKGIDLRRYIRMVGGRLGVEQTLAILRPVMTALEQVHAEELVHRDISPDNIMMMSDGTVKLLDFGAAREVLDADPDRNLDQSTEAILKHGFAPMEQYQRSGTLGPWTDVYALAATMYYCLTGAIPPDAPNRFMEGAQVSWQQIPGLNPKQVKALVKAMELVPKDRTRSVEELELALFGSVAVKAVKRSESRTDWGKSEKRTGTKGKENDKKKETENRNTRQGGKSSSRGKLAAAAAAVLVAAGAGFFLLSPKEEAPAPAESGIFDGGADRTISYGDGSRAEIWLDEEGRENGRILRDSGNEIIYKFTAGYNENGDMLFQNTYDAADKLLRADTYTYDGTLLTQWERQLADKTVLEVVDYDYNADGERIASETRNGEGKVLSNRVWEYDENGLLQTSTRRNADGTTSDWTYDANGNVKAFEYREEDGDLDYRVEYTKYEAIREEKLMNRLKKIPGQVETMGSWDAGNWGGTGGGGGGGGGSEGKPSSPIAVAIEDDWEEEEAAETTAETMETQETEGEEPAAEVTEETEAPAQVVEPGEDVIWVNTARKRYGPDGALEYSYETTYDRKGLATEEVCTDAQGNLESRTEYLYSGEEETGTRRSYPTSGEYTTWYLKDICADTLRTYEESDWGTGYSCYNLAGDIEKRVFYGEDGEIDNESSYSYDKWGTLQGHTYRYYDSHGGYTEQEYDAQDQILSDKSYDKSGNVTGWKDHTYREGLEVTEVAHNADGSEKNRTEYSYDTYGRCSRRETTYYYEDGSYSVYAYDGEYNQLSADNYDASGVRKSHSEYSYEYDSNGNISKKLTHDETGRLTGENRYRYDENGTMVEQTSLYYYEDGSSYEYVYDGDFNKVSSTNRDSSGKITSRNTYSYDFNEAGKVDVEYCYDEKGALETRTVYTYNENGDTLEYHVYDGAGKQTYWVEYLYDENGNFVDSEFHWE